MKLNTLALTLIAAALLPTFAYAGTDAVADSFDRSFINESFINASGAGTSQIAASFERAFGDETIVNAYRAKSDQVAASFGRDLYREPVNSSAVIAGAADPLVEIFNVALSGTTDAVLASFERDLYREPVSSATVVAGAADPLMDAFNAALINKVGKPVKQAAVTSNDRISN